MNKRIEDITRNIVTQGRKYNADPPELKGIVKIDLKDVTPEVIIGLTQNRLKFKEEL